MCLLLAVSGTFLTSVLPAVMPAQASSQKNILIIGDSVSTVLKWWPKSMKPFWGKTYNATLEVWGCQRLLMEGCNPNKAISALDSVLKHRNDSIDLVVVMTGYNDKGDEYFRQAMHKIRKATRSIGAELMWATYRENGDSRIKARGFNKIIRAEAKRFHFPIFDWDAIARNKSDWFPGQSVHMRPNGGEQLGRLLKKAVDAYFTPSSSTTSTSTTIVFDTSTTSLP